MVHHYSRKLCFAFIWISILCATGYCQQQFLTKTQGDTNTLVIILSVVGPIGTVGLYLCCCFIYYCVSRSKYDERRHQYFASRHAQTYVVQSTTQQHTNNHQHRTLSHDTAFLHATNNSGGRQQTMVHSNSIRQTAQGTR